MSVVLESFPPRRARAGWSEHRLRRRRRILSEGFEAALRDAHAPRGRWMSASIPVQRDQVRDAEREIERLIGRLRGGRPIDDDALRLAQALLIARGSPLFEPAEPGTLRRCVRVVCDTAE